MEKAWHEISRKAPNSQKMHFFLDYFERYWYNKDHKILSCADDVHRTTNSCKGYHRKLNSRLPNTANIFLVFNNILKEAHYFDRKI